MARGSRGHRERLFGVSLVLSSEQPLSARRAPAVRARSARRLSELARRCGAHSGVPRYRPARCATSSIASVPSTADLGLERRGAGRGRAGRRSSRSPSRSSPRRVRDARNTPTRKHMVVRTHTFEGTLVVEIENDGVPLGTGWLDRRRPAARRAGGVHPAASSSSASARPALGRAARRAAARGERRRVKRSPTPKALVLVVNDHDVVHWGFRTMLGELDWSTLPLGEHRRRGAGADARARPRRRARRPLPRRGVRPRCLRAAARRAPRAARAALSGAGRSRRRRRAPAARAALSQGLARRRTSRAPWVVALGHGLSSPRPAPVTGALMLSGREREVLERIAGGATNREIALALHLSPHTIKEHTSALYASSTCATAPRPCRRRSGCACSTNQPGQVQQDLRQRVRVDSLAFPVTPPPGGCPLPPVGGTRCRHPARRPGFKACSILHAQCNGAVPRRLGPRSPRRPARSTARRRADRRVARSPFPSSDIRSRRPEPWLPPGDSRRTSKQWSWSRSPVRRRRRCADTLATSSPST